jgi:hypothetical protein
MYGIGESSYICTEFKGSDMVKHPLHAVLTGDIVNSTQLPPMVEFILLERLKQTFSNYITEFYRGDSFQIYMRDPVGSLRVALLARSLAIGLNEADEEPALSDVRISIGIGPVVLPVKTPGTARGEAFLLSGRGLDEIQHTGRRLSMVCDRPIADIGLQVMADYLDAIYRGMTAKQAAAIVWLLRGATQQEVVVKLGKSKSTVSQLVTSGRWSEIERILQQFENLIKQFQ